MPEKSILITGSGGFLGGTATETLRKAGENVIGTDVNVESELAQKLKLRRLDITNREETLAFIWNNLPETILHFAGISVPKEVANNEALGQKVNVESVMNLLDAVVNARKKDPSYNPVILVAGTVEQFGDSTVEGEVLTEESARNPINPYGRQKQLMAEKFLQRCIKEGIRGYVIIEGQTAGVSPSGEISQKKGFLIPDLASQVAEIEASGRDQGIIVTGELSHQRNIIDLNDAIKAWIEVAKKTPKPGEYIVCAEKSRPLIDVLKILIENSSVVNIVHEIDKSRGSGGTDRFYSPGKIMVATKDWRPEVELEKTIKDVLEFQRRHLVKGNK